MHEKYKQWTNTKQSTKNRKKVKMKYHSKRERNPSKNKTGFISNVFVACIRIVLIFIFAGFRFDFAFVGLLLFFFDGQCSQFTTLLPRKGRREKKKEFIFLIFMSVVK